MRKNGKKLLSLMLALILALCALTACSGNGQNETKEPAQTTAPAETTAPTETTAPVETTVPAEALFSCTGTFTTFDCYADGTYKFEFSGMATEYGTWSYTDGAFTITTEGGNDIPVELDADGNMSFTYVADINPQLTDSFTCANEVWSAAVGAGEQEAILSFTGTFTTFDCYADGTYKFEFSGMATEYGTWTWADWTFTVTTEGGNVIVATMNEETHALEFTYVADINPQLTDSFTCESIVWSTVLDVSTGSYTPAE